MVIRITLFAAVFAAALVAQSTPGLSAPDPAAISIAFFSLHCQSAGDRAAAKGPSAGDAAARLGVQPAEVAGIDQACAAYLGQERSLREEALKAHEVARASGKDLDLSTVKAFTSRRATLAIVAMARLKSQLSLESVARLDTYLTSGFAGSLKSRTR